MSVPYIRTQATSKPSRRSAWSSIGADARLTASIDLTKLCRNYARLRAHALRPLWAVVKANAYGHGAVPVAQALVEAGCEGFCVASLEQAMELRSAGLEARILVLGGISPDAIPLASRENLDVALVGPERLGAITSLSASYPVRWHVKVDTGMGRLGFTLPELAASRDLLSCLGGQMSGIFSHLATADGGDDQLARSQRGRFDDALRILATRGELPPFIHIGNTSASVRRELLGGDTMVRAGIGLFGFSIPPLDPSRPLEPVLELRAPVLRMKTMQAGETIGYGASFVAERETPVATVACGYADGYPRELSNLGSIDVEGSNGRVLGLVSMDSMCVEAPAGTEVGALVRIYSSAPGAPNSIQSAAAACGKIPYELLSLLSRKIARQYWRS